MNLFTIIVGICTIIGAAASLFTATYVVKITHRLQIDASEKTRLTAIGKGNNVAGGDVHGGK